jgi:hypothetical protein
VRISLRLLVEYYLRMDYTFIVANKQGLSVLVTGYKRFIQFYFLLQLPVINLYFKVLNHLKIHCYAKRY